MYYYHALFRTLGKHIHSYKRKGNVSDLHQLDPSMLVATHFSLPSHEIMDITLANKTISLVPFTNDKRNGSAKNNADLIPGLHASRT